VPLIITKGLGSLGDGSTSGLLCIQGWGSPGDGTVITLSSTEVYGDRIELVFSVPVQVVGPAALPAYWPITSSTPGAPVPVVTSVNVSGVRIILYYTEGRDAASYTLAIPPTGIKDLSDNPYTGPFTQPFSGTGIDPFISLAQAEDALHARVIFSEAVNESDALVVSNYSIPGLSIYAVERESGTTIYRLTTSLQSVGVSYTLTITGIRDLQGNLI
jgi:hypothetical protein